MEPRGAWLIQTSSKMADLLDWFESDVNQSGGVRQQAQPVGGGNPFDDIDLTAIQSVSAADSTVHCTSG